jgi:cytochrome c peroxidase
LRQELAAAGITPLPSPPEVSDEMFALGQALFFDKVLSGNEEISCATCHLPEFHTGDGRTLSNGVGGIGLGPERAGGYVLRRNAPPLFALHLERRLLWDGRVEDLGASVRVPPNVVLPDAMRAVFAPGLELVATQAMLPPISFPEMLGFGNELSLLGWDTEAIRAIWAGLLERLLDLPGYLELLRAAYPGVALQDLTFAHAANAIAAFEVRAFARTDSPFERFVRGDDAALTSGQVAGGLEFFGHAGCARCHSGPLLSDQEHHNIGLPQIAFISPFATCVDCGGDDFGRYGVTSDPADRFEFRTPSLLGVELTGPYGHAGQFAQLRDFVAHYRDVERSLRGYDLLENVTDPQLSRALVPNSEEVLASLDPRLRSRRAFDVDAVVEFLRALTAEDASDLSDIVPASVPSGLPIF